MYKVQLQLLQLWVELEELSEIAFSDSEINWADLGAVLFPGQGGGACLRRTIPPRCRRCTLKPLCITSHAVPPFCQTVHMSSSQPSSEAPGKTTERHHLPRSADLCSFQMSCASLCDIPCGKLRRRQYRLTTCKKAPWLWELVMGNKVVLHVPSR